MADKVARLLPMLHERVNMLARYDLRLGSHGSCAVPLLGKST
jgi:hypothetical protein